MTTRDRFSQRYRPRFACTAWLGCLIAIGCSPATVKETPAVEEPFEFQAQAYEVTADDLLAARLPIAEAAEGWIRLFDGHTMFGWSIAGEANWRIEDEMIVVDRGAKSFLVSSTRWADYELVVDFRADASTNSGVFLRTPLEPQTPATDCFEVNIAPPDNPFPTGSLVQRVKAKPFVHQTDTWHKLRMICDGPNLTVSIDGTIVCETTEAISPRKGYISLQHNSGKVAFRDIRLRPLGLKPLVDAELNEWSITPDMPGEFRINDAGELVVDGGKQQLESNQSYGDFCMLAEYKMDDAKSNSGLFFRSIPGDVMMGYECQVSNEVVDGNPLAPADCGAGGIFRRQDARIVAGEPARYNTILLHADGLHFATWVNGLAVCDFVDARPPDENPRKGSRLEAGTLIIQGHDPTTQATFRKLEVVPIPTSP